MIIDAVVMNQTMVRCQIKPHVFTRSKEAWMTTMQTLMAGFIRIKFQCIMCFAMVKEPLLLQYGN